MTVIEDTKCIRGTVLAAKVCVLSREGVLQKVSFKRGTTVKAIKTVP